MKRRLHPLSYILLCIFYSSLAIALEHPHLLFIVFVLATLVDFRDGLKALGARLEKLEKLFWLIISIIVIQLLFRRGGGVIFSLGPIRIHQAALFSSAFLSFRILIIYMCAISLSSLDFSLYRAAFSAIRLPEELSFMVSYMAHLIPEYSARFKGQMQELRDREIVLRKLGIKAKLKLYRILALSAIAELILQSGRQAIALELRGFRSKGRPGCLHRHRFGFWDIAGLAWVLLVLSLILYLRVTWYKNCSLCVVI
jgi:energy-coupling factor transport system permease protein